LFKFRFAGRASCVHPKVKVNPERRKTELKHLKPFYVMAAILILPGLLPGCAVERKCGWEGCPGDAQITENVQAHINQHPDVGPPDAIYVQTLNHVVYLSGEVSTGLMKRTAESVAMQTPGVTRIVNDIAVTH
jgi:BON domain-containing protein